MPTVDTALELEPGGALVPGRAADDALLGLLASMASSDGEINERELDLLAKLRADLQDRRAVADWARSVARPYDLERLRALVVDPDDRWKTLRFAGRMAWKDGALTAAERSLLDGIAAALELPPAAVDRVVREMSPDDGKRFTVERILRTLMDTHWDSVQLAAGDVVSDDLKSTLPPMTETVARVGLEKVEVMAVCTAGVAGRFQEGAVFLPWSELVTYTRERGLGEALRLHTEAGRSYTLVDQRMTGLARVLDRLLDLHDGAPVEPLVTPRIDTLRGD
jgi:tellurite resistance protein